jgi:hypothetical protein
MPSDAVPTPDQLEDLVYSITVSDEMVPGSKWTRRQLKRLNFWPEWHAAEKEKLYRMDLAKMFGKPEPHPAPPAPLSCVLSGNTLSSMMD